MGLQYGTELVFGNGGNQNGARQFFETSVDTPSGDV
jgi:hypothetical protein